MAAISDLQRIRPTECMVHHVNVITIEMELKIGLIGFDPERSADLLRRQILPIFAAWHGSNLCRRWRSRGGHDRIAALRGYATEQETS